MTLKNEGREAKAAQGQQQKADWREQMGQLEHEVDSLNEQMTDTPKYLAWDDFPKEANCVRVSFRLRLAL